VTIFTCADQRDGPKCLGRLEMPLKARSGMALGRTTQGFPLQSPHSPARKSRRHRVQSNKGKPTAGLRPWFPSPPGSPRVVTGQPSMDESQKEEVGKRSSSSASGSTSTPTGVSAIAKPDGPGQLVPTPIAVAPSSSVSHRVP
jgi:hypothetical protein